MQRVFIAAKTISHDTAVISDREQVHHLKDVLHFAPGDEFTLFDEQGNVYAAAVEKITAAAVTAKVKHKERLNQPQDRPRLTIACAIPKKAKMDDIVDKLTQLGVERIIPLDTARVIIRLDRRKSGIRSERWRKIALSAAEQSRRNTLVAVEPVRDVREVIASSLEYDLKLIPALCTERKSLKEALERSRPQNILVLIGPEGDFTSDEIKLAKDNGFIPVTLGENVLRVETAAVAVSGFIRLYYEKNG